MYEIVMCCPTNIPAKKHKSKVHSSMIRPPCSDGVGTSNGGVFNHAGVFKIVNKPFTHFRTRLAFGFNLHVNAVNDLSAKRIAELLHCVAMPGGKVVVDHPCGQFVALVSPNKGGEAFKMLLQYFTVFIATLPPMIYSSLPRQAEDVIAVHASPFAAAIAALPVS